MFILLLSLTALATATLSGVFGMAGGMLLMGVYVALLPVPTAMVMHGGTQLISNVSRAWLLRRHVYWRGFAYYVAGSIVAFAAMLGVRYTPEPLVVFLGLGLTPFIARLLPADWLDFQRPRAALVTGFQVAVVQLMAGAAGPLLDIAFVETRLDKNQVVATKAATQVFSHSLKLVYFGTALQTSQLSLPLLAAVAVATLAGTRLGTAVLERLSDVAFKRYSRGIVLAIGAIYLYKAASLWLGGSQALGG
jgi:uncharacterized membrane protein YfcA